MNGNGLKIKFGSPKYYSYIYVLKENKRVKRRKNKMCSSGGMYLDEDDYLKKQKEEKFYNKEEEKWDYYSGLPNPKAYESE